MSTTSNLINKNTKKHAFRISRVCYLKSYNNSEQVTKIKQLTIKSAFYKQTDKFFG